MCASQLCGSVGQCSTSKLSFRLSVLSQPKTSWLVVEVRRRSLLLLLLLGDVRELSWCVAAAAGCFTCVYVCVCVYKRSFQAPTGDMLPVCSVHAPDDAMAPSFLLQHRLARLRPSSSRLTLDAQTPNLSSRCSSNSPSEAVWVAHSVIRSVHHSLSPSLTHSPFNHSLFSITPSLICSHCPPPRPSNRHILSNTHFPQRINANQLAQNEQLEISAEKSGRSECKTKYRGDE